MATVVKDFKIKSGLIVEGANASVNGFDVLTKATADQNYIIALIGGSATPNNTQNTVVLRDGNGNFAAGVVTADLVGDVTGTVSDISNHSTTDLSEGTNQYFTTQRALDATASAYDTAGAADQALSDAEDYTDGRETAITTAYQAYADQAEVDAKAYTDQEVAALVNGAPELLDTLNELAAAIGDDENFAVNLATSVGEKVSKAGDTMTGLLVLSADPDANLGAATKQYVDAAQTAAEEYADALDTDDIEEGTNNLYHTDVRAKTSAASLLTGASLTNITITGDETGLVITAENGVADSDTDDLDEGTTNLYFTDARAVDALEAVVPNFTEVDINSVATQVASTLSVATASQAVAYSFSGSSYRTAKFLVKVAYGSHTEVSEVLLTLDTSDNIAITEYAVVGTNGSASTISAGMSGTNVQLLVTTANNDSTVNVMGTLLA
jgi:hypothetical protein